MVAIADALRSVTRGTDIVARWGGDEFCVIGPGPGMCPMELERRMRERVLLSPPVPVDVWEPKVCAGGAMLAPWDCGTLDTLLGKADQEMYLRGLYGAAAHATRRPRRRQPKIAATRTEPNLVRSALEVCIAGWQAGDYPGVVVTDTSPAPVVSESADARERAAEKYDIFGVQEKWLPVWDELAPFRSGDPDDARPKKYVLDMFPYPSGDLHMGHAEAYALGDVVARYWVQRGFNVMHPIGWDAFGLPAENAAIKRGVDPAAWTYDNIAHAEGVDAALRVLVRLGPRAQHLRPGVLPLEPVAVPAAASRRAWPTASRRMVNWCPNDQTVLANEQVVDGRCERCDTPVTKKKLTQWYFRITDYADRLLDDMEQLEGKWPEKVLLMQRNWIGRSTGADVAFEIEGRDEPVTVYTTRPDTLFGATFFVVAADSDLAAELATGHRPRFSESSPTYLDAGAADQRGRPAVHRASEDGRLPAAVRGQPGQRRAAAHLRRRLRAGRLRPRRDHGRARPRPARPRLRAGVRPAGTRGG